MCMMTYYAPGAQPDADALRNGAYLNEDGHGFAIVASRRLIIRHGLHFDAVLAEFKRLRAEHPDGPALFHSRMGTAGDMTERNCHPFRVGGDRRTVLAHNGVFPAVMQPTDGDPRCDSRLLAEDALRDLDLSSEDVQRRITEWMGPYNKIVILSVNPRYGANAYILNESHGVWVGNTWYSNHDYLPYIPPTKTLDSGKWSAENGWTSNPDNEECQQCGSGDDVEAEARLCLACDICLDCGEHYDNCQCFAPTTRARDTSADEWSAVVDALEDTDAGARAALAEAMANPRA